MRLALIAWIYQLGDQSETVSQKVNLITILIIVLTLNSNLPLQHLLAKKQISRCDFWFTSTAIAALSGLATQYFLGLSVIVTVAAFLVWVCFQSISFFYAVPFYPKLMQALATVGMSVLTATGAFWATYSIQAGGKVLFATAAAFCVLVILGIFQINQDAFKKIARALRFRVSEAIIVSVFQYSFLIQIASGVNTEGSLTFFVLLQIGAILATVPNILSSYLLSDFIETDRRRFNLNIALAVFLFSLFCLAATWIIDASFLIPLLFIASFGTAGAMRIVSIALVSLSKTHIPFISNIVHVGIFYILMKSHGEISYSAYMESVVFASMISAALFSGMAIKWLR